MDGLHEQRDKIIEELEVLNRAVKKQNSTWQIFKVGIIYGIGFFVGSAIIATIAFGILGPWFAEIDVIRETFERGADMLGR